MFQAIVTHINRLNGINKCSGCGKLVSLECDGKGSSCKANEDRQTLLKMDPRCHESFGGLSKYEQARRLFRFHASCISNLLSFYGNDFSVEESLCVRWHWSDDWFLGMSSFHEYNPKAHWLFMGLIELDIAKSDLSGNPYYYESAFAGREIDPFTGSSYRDSLHFCVFQVFRGLPRERNERGFHMQDWGRWYPSQYNHLEGAIREMLLKRDARADSLVGKSLANRIDIMYKTRVAMLPRLADVFPLNWMPIFDDDYEPPTSPWG